MAVAGVAEGAAGVTESVAVAGVAVGAAGVNEEVHALSSALVRCRIYEPQSEVDEDEEEAIFQVAQVVSEEDDVDGLTRVYAYPIFVCLNN